MSGAVELADASQVNIDKLCPLMSGQVVPGKAPGAIHDPNSLQLVPVTIPCAGERCQLWDQELDRCDLSAIGGLDQVLTGLCHNVIEVRKELMHLAAAVTNAGDHLTDRLACLEPPKGSLSPIARIAESVEELASYARKRNTKTF